MLKFTNQVADYLVTLFEDNVRACQNPSEKTELSVHIPNILPPATFWMGLVADCEHIAHALADAFLELGNSCFLYCSVLLSALTVSGPVLGCCEIC